MLIAFKVDGHDPARRKTFGVLSMIAPENASLWKTPGNKKPELVSLLGFFWVE
ncbi:hypothetical protein O59_000903 [Cellvibrio sp. BR]|nr:hypothetical protein O59_000903 [Cellvibrio sp. BR]